MCLIALHWRPKTPRPLLLLANRDERHARATQSLAHWDDAPDILAGRDLAAGGTWLGVNRLGAFAALTNYREPGSEDAERSRGFLVSDFLRGDKDPSAYASSVESQLEQYAGFNLLVGNADQLIYLSNRESSGPIELKPGTYGLSNALLDSPWPKLLQVRDGLENLANDEQIADEAAFSLMNHREVYPDESLPDTGVGRSLERLLSPAFICTPIYGTRCTTWLRMDQDAFHMAERNFDAQGQMRNEIRHTLKIAPT